MCLSKAACAAAESQRVGRVTATAGNGIVYLNGGRLHGFAKGDVGRLCGSETATVSVLATYPRSSKARVTPADATAPLCGEVVFAF